MGGVMTMTNDQLARLDAAERRAAFEAAGAEAARLLENPILVETLDGMEQSLLEALRATDLANDNAKTAGIAGLQAVHIFRSTLAGKIRAGLYAKAERERAQAA
jgi:hypothetical protein